MTLATGLGAAQNVVIVVTAVAPPSSAVFTSWVLSPTITVLPGPN
jgi:hypothetical protein